MGHSEPITSSHEVHVQATNAERSLNVRVLCSKIREISSTQKEGRTGVSDDQGGQQSRPLGGVVLILDHQGCFICFTGGDTDLRNKRESACVFYQHMCIEEEGI